MIIFFALKIMRKWLFDRSIKKWRNLIETFFYSITLHANFSLIVVYYNWIMYRYDLKGFQMCVQNRKMPENTFDTCGNVNLKVSLILSINFEYFLWFIKFRFRFFYFTADLINLQFNPFSFIRKIPPKRHRANPKKFTKWIQKNCLRFLMK